MQSSAEARPPRARPRYLLDPRSAARTFLYRSFVGDLDICLGVRLRTLFLTVAGLARRSRLRGACFLLLMFSHIADRQVRSESQTERSRARRLRITNWDAAAHWAEREAASNWRQWIRFGE